VYVLRLPWQEEQPNISCCVCPGNAFLRALLQNPLSSTSLLRLLTVDVEQGQEVPSLFRCLCNLVSGSRQATTIVDELLPFLKMQPMLHAATDVLLVSLSISRECRDYVLRNTNCDEELAQESLHKRLVTNFKSDHNVFGLQGNRTSLSQEVVAKSPLLDVLLTCMASSSAQPSLTSKIIMVIRMLASHCTLQQLPRLKTVFTSEAISGIINSEKHTIETRAHTIDIYRICLSSEEFYKHMKDCGDLSLLLNNVLKASLQHADLRQPAVNFFSSLLVHPDGIDDLINLREADAENRFIATLVLLLDSEISRGNMMFSISFIHEALVILWAISNRLNTSFNTSLLSKIQGHQFTFTNMLNKLSDEEEARSRVLHLMPLIQGLQKHHRHP